MTTTYMQDENGSVFTTKFPQYHAESKRLPAAKGKALLADQSKRHLQALLQEGNEVFTQVRSVNRAGDSRKISVFVVSGGSIRNISILVAEALGLRTDDVSVTISGCGMDMGWYLTNLIELATGKKLRHRTLS